MGLQLSGLLGNTPEFCLNAQRAIDLWEAGKTARRKFERISSLKVA
jgi:plasmid maintenance system antidote protein VapI